MIEINEKLKKKFQLQNDGINDTDEEELLIQVARSYALAEGAMSVLSCLRTNISHIFFGKAADTLGLDTSNRYLKVDSVWEEMIIERIHPDDWAVRNLQELLFFRFSSLLQRPMLAYPWHMENSMRMHDLRGNWHNMLHRIFYFVSEGKPGISYALCVYCLTDSLFQDARIINTLTGESRILKAEEEGHHLLSEREVEVLELIRKGMTSKEVADYLFLSKNTVDRHRQNIIAKLQVRNATEACHKAKLLGLIK